MNINELNSAMPYLISSKIPVCLIGPHGRGKTSFVRKYAKDNNYDTFIYLKMSAREPGELIGMMHLAQIDKEVAVSLNLREGMHKTEFALPDWFPTNPKAKVLIFLDEINRAPRYALQPLFEMMTERSLNGVAFPDSTAIIAAANPETNNYSVTDMADLAWTSRFCTLDFYPTNQEWLQYAKDSNIHPSIVAFITENPTRLEGKREKYDVTVNKSPDPRAWEWISNFRNSNPPAAVEHEVIQGLIGPGDAVLYLAFSKEFKPVIRAEEIFTKYEKVRGTILEYSQQRRLDLLKTTVDEILATPREVANVWAAPVIAGLRQFILDIPRDLSAMLVSELFPLSDAAADGLCEDQEIADHFTNRDYKIIEKDADPASLAPEGTKTAKNEAKDEKKPRKKKAKADDVLSRKDEPGETTSEEAVEEEKSA